MSQTITAVTPANFQQEVVESPVPVVIDFWADWCGPCKAMLPGLEKLAAERDDIKIVKVDTEVDQTLAAHFQVMNLPTLVILSGGEQIGRINGAQAPRALAEQIDRAIGIGD